jgi:hypothetical protein
MRTHHPVLFVLVVGMAAIATAKPDIALPIKLALPGGDGGIGFDDLMYSPALHRVLAPAGRTGKLDLIDPKTQKVDSIGGFSTETDKFAGGHGEGTTSADAGGGYIFASDRGGARSTSSIRSRRSS